MNAEESWAGTSMWRRNGVVRDFPFSIFQMVSRISSVNFDSRLQLQGYPQLLIYFQDWSYWSTDHTIKRKWAMKNWMKCQKSDWIIDFFANEWTVSN